MTVNDSMITIDTSWMPTEPMAVNYLTERTMSNPRVRSGDEGVVNTKIKGVTDLNLTHLILLVMGMVQIALCAKILGSLR